MADEVNQPKEKKNKVEEKKKTVSECEFARREEK